MIYPIVVYGNSVLRRKAQDVKIDVEDTFIKTLSEDMFETMEGANGIGLAAPQIGKGIRMFVVGIPGNEKQGIKEFRRTFVNPYITAKSDDFSESEEGCLSIPTIHQRIKRPQQISIEYYDLEGTLHEEIYKGMEARVIQHEYDHIEGILFIDYLNPLEKRLLKRKLLDISKGTVNTDYRITIPTRRD